MACGNPLCVNVHHVNWAAVRNTAGWNGALRCSDADMSSKYSAFRAWAEHTCAMFSRRLKVAQKFLLETRCKRGCAVGWSRLEEQPWEGHEETIRSRNEPVLSDFSL